MKAASLEILENAQLPAKQARAILEAVDMELSAHEQNLATKMDLRDLRAEMVALESRLRVQIKEVEASLTRWTFKLFLGQTAFYIGIAYFFWTHPRR